MKLNWSAQEYAMLCTIADQLDTTPAILVREWALAEAIRHYRILLAAQGRVGQEGREGTPLPSPSPTLPNAREQDGVNVLTQGEATDSEH